MNCPNCNKKHRLNTKPLQLCDREYLLIYRHLCILTLDLGRGVPYYANWESEKAKYEIWKKYLSSFVK